MILCFINFKILIVLNYVVIIQQSISKITLIKYSNVHKYLSIKLIHFLKQFLDHFLLN